MAIKGGEFISLSPREVEVDAGRPKQLIVIAGCLENQMRVGFDKDFLPLLSLKCPLAKLYMEEANQVDHSGVDCTVQRSRMKVWIIKGSRLSKAVINNRFEVVVEISSFMVKSWHWCMTLGFLQLWFLAPQPLICSDRSKSGTLSKED